MPSNDLPPKRCAVFGLKLVAESQELWTCGLEHTLQYRRTVQKDGFGVNARSNQEIGMGVITFGQRQRRVEEDVECDGGHGRCPDDQVRAFFIPPLAPRGWPAAFAQGLD